MEPALDLLLDKLPPSSLEKNLQWFHSHIPNQNQCASLVKGSNNQPSRQNHYIPFQLIDNTSQDGERPFLIGAYNDAGSGQYRSPWTNRLYHWNKDNHSIIDVQSGEIDLDTSTGKLRCVEVEFNQVWDAYKNLYYGHEAVGSVYLKNDEENSANLKGCFCIQKQSSDCASWHSISFVHAKEVSECEFEYSIDTTVHVVTHTAMASYTEHNECQSTSNQIHIGTTMSKSCCKTCKTQADKEEIHKDHIVHMGSIIEAHETELRSNLERNVMPKHQETIAAIQKKQTRRPQVNPLMGMMMNSEMLKKRLAKSSSVNDSN